RDVLVAEGRGQRHLQRALRLDAADGELGVRFLDFREHARAHVQVAGAFDGQAEGVGLAVVPGNGQAGFQGGEAGQGDGGGGSVRPTSTSSYTTQTSRWCGGLRNRTSIDAVSEDQGSYWRSLLASAARTRRADPPRRVSARLVKQSLR